MNIITNNTNYENIKNIILNKKEFLLVKTKNNRQLELLFNVIKQEDKIIISSKITSPINLKNKMSNDYENLKFIMNLKDNTAYLDTVNKLEDEFSGTDLINFCLKVLKSFNIVYVELEDLSNYIVKENKIMENGKIKKVVVAKIPLSILSLIRSYQTYYMKFKFRPYINKNNINFKINLNNNNNLNNLNNKNNLNNENLKNMTIILKNLVKKLHKIGWDDFDKLFMEGLKLIDIMNNNKKIESNFNENLRRRNTNFNIIGNNKNESTQIKNFNFGKYNFSSFNFGNSQNNKYATLINRNLKNNQNNKNSTLINKNFHNENKNINNYMKYLKHETLYNLQQKSYKIEVMIWIEYWILMLKSYDELKKKYKSKYPSPFIAVKEEFNEKDWKMFTSWLDIYSLQFKIFEKKNGYKFYNDISKNLTKYIKIPGYENIDKIKKILTNAKWRRYI